MIKKNCSAKGFILVGKCPEFCPVCGEDGSVVSIEGECYCLSCSAML